MTWKEIISVQPSHQAVRAKLAERQIVSGPVQLHPTKGLVVRMEHGGIMEEPIRDWNLGGACFGELATGSLLETIIIISPTVQFIVSAAQGL